MGCLFRLLLFMPWSNYYLAVGGLVALVLTAVSPKDGIWAVLAVILVCLIAAWLAIREGKIASRSIAPHLAERTDKWVARFILQHVHYYLFPFVTPKVATIASLPMLLCLLTTTILLVRTQWLLAGAMLILTVLFTFLGRKFGLILNPEQWITDTYRGRHTLGGHQFDYLDFETASIDIVEFEVMTLGILRDSGGHFDIQSKVKLDYCLLLVARQFVFNSEGERTLLFSRQWAEVLSLAGLGDLVQ